MGQIQFRGEAITPSLGLAGFGGAGGFACQFFPFTLAFVLVPAFMRRR